MSGNSKFLFFLFLCLFSSEEEGEEILRQRGQFPSLPFTASDSGSPSPRSPRSPGSVSSYSNGGSPHPVGVPWGDFSATGNFKFPNMPHKYASNGRVKKKPPASEGIAKSPGSGKCSFIAGSCLDIQTQKTLNLMICSTEIDQCFCLVLSLHVIAYEDIIC